MTTKNETARRKAEKRAMRLTEPKLRAMVLRIHAILDEPGYWEADTLTGVARVLTDRGFAIRDPNDSDAYDKE